MTQAPEGTFYTLTRRALTHQNWPANAEIVKLDDMRLYGARNAGEAIMRLSGVLVLPFGETNFPLGAGLRGATDRQTLVLVDGRSVSGVGLDPADLTEISIEQIDHIEVVRGGMSALYGPNASGGVINIISKRAASVGLPLSHVSYEARSYSSHQTRLDFGSRWDRLDFTFYGNAHRLSGFRDNTDTRATNIGGNLGYSFKNAGKLQVDMGNFHRGTGDPGSDPLTLMPNQFNNKDEKLATRPSASVDTNTTYIRSSYIAPLGDDHHLAVRWFDTEHTVEYTDFSNPNPALVAHSEDHTQSRGLDAQWDGPLGLSAGGSFTHDRLDHADEINFDRSYIATTEEWGLFAQELMHVGRASFSAAGRYDQTTRGGHFWNPRFQSWIDATERLRLFASAAHSFGLPRLSDLFTNSPFFTGNMQLHPEKTWTYDAGFELHQESNTFRVTFYKSIVSDALQLRPITLDALQNIADVRRQGAEAQWSHVLTAWFQEDIRYTYLDNRGRPDGFTDRVALAQSPRHRVDWLMSFHPGRQRKVRIDSDIRYEGSRYAGDNQTGGKFGSQVTLDFRVSWPWRQADLYMGTQNALDKRYEEYEGYPLPGRTVYGGIQLRLWG